ncbi:unnamed protein product [Dicrocoelium dendriticum]|nr:unnamed protein product [Dicrocoelium dendriticum]
MPTSSIRSPTKVTHRNTWYILECMRLARLNLPLTRLVFQPPSGYVDCRGVLNELNRIPMGHSGQCLNWTDCAATVISNRLLPFSTLQGPTSGVLSRKQTQSLKRYTPTFV